MKVIRHQTVGINFCKGYDIKFKPLEKKPVVFIFTKNQVISVAMIVYMVNGIRLKGFSWIGHFDLWFRLLKAETWQVFVKPARSGSLIFEIDTRSAMSF